MTATASRPSRATPRALPASARPLPVVGGRETARRRVDHAARESVAALRAELAGIDPERACCRAAERAGLGEAALGRARDPVVARLAVRLEHAQEGRSAFAWSSAAEHCRLAWLRGHFLACGSLSLAGGRTHLEFVVGRNEAPNLAARLAESNLPASLRIRRGAGVVTWKSAPTVIHFLRLVGASSGVLDLESRIVARELRGELNRQLNAETANLRRGIAAAARQVEAIETLRAAGRFESLPPIVRQVALSRLSAPESSVSDLAEELTVARARVQRALERIESEAARVR